jgi:hypothetical protein
VREWLDRAFNEQDLYEQHIRNTAAAAAAATAAANSTASASGSGSSSGSRRLVYSTPFQAELLQALYDEEYEHDRFADGDAPEAGNPIQSLAMQSCTTIMNRCLNVWHKVPLAVEWYVHTATLCFPLDPSLCYCW